MTIKMTAWPSNERYRAAAGAEISLLPSLQSFNDFHHSLQHSSPPAVTRGFGTFRKNWKFWKHFCAVGAAENLMKRWWNDQLKSKVRFVYCQVYRNHHVIVLYSLGRSVFNPHFFFNLKIIFLNCSSSCSVMISSKPPWSLDMWMTNSL